MKKTALITGASQGIGRAIACLLGQEGYDVAFNYLSNHDMAQDTLEKLKALGGNPLCYQCDMRDGQAVRAMAERVLEAYGHLDLLVNNAGVTRYLPFLEATEELWEDITRTDWKSAYFLTQQVARNMVATGTKGVVINITSIHQSCCFPISNIYGPTKAALLKFTEHAALELAPYGIRVVAISPGCISIRPNQGESARGKALAGRIPLGRLGEAEEIAQAVLYLASDQARYVTGTCLSIDGGALLPTHLDNFAHPSPNGEVRG